MNGHTSAPAPLTLAAPYAPAQFARDVIDAAHWAERGDAVGFRAAIKEPIARLVSRHDLLQVELPRQGNNVAESCRASHFCTSGWVCVASGPSLGRQTILAELRPVDLRTIVCRRTIIAPNIRGAAMKYDTRKVRETLLALFGVFSSSKTGRVWKRYDFPTMDGRHEKGVITHPPQPAGVGPSD